MLIEIENLTVYGKKQGDSRHHAVDYLRQHLFNRSEPSPLLKNINCSFSYGVNLILGPNGSGKSFLVQALGGVILPDNGKILIDGQEARPPILHQNVGYLPQTFGFYPKLTAQETLDYIALLKGIVDSKTRKHTVEQIMQRMGLLAVADQKVGTYSRGMRQKVGIAQALLGNPPVLVLDEPTAGLDPEARNNLRSILAEIGQEQIIIWTSSLITDTFCADRVLVLKHGENRFWGSPVELGGCANLPKGNLLATDELHWVARLEQGYRSILLNPPNVGSSENPLN